MIDVPMIGTCIAAMMAATGAVLVFRLWALNQYGTTGGGIMSGIVQGVAIGILNTLFERLAFALTDMENQRTQEMWEDSFISKLFGFQFLNTYTGLIYIAFIKYAGGYYDLELYGETDKCFASDNDLIAYKQSQIGLPVCTNDNTTPMSYTNYTQGMFDAGSACYPVTTKGGNDWSICYAELQTALIGILLTKIVSDAFFDYFYPALMNCINKKQEGEGSGEGLNANTAQGLVGDDYETQADLERYETTLYDYNQIILNWGFIVMFSGAWPLTPIVVMIYNISQTIVDQEKLLRQFQRPLYRSQATIGVWTEILEYLSYIGIVVHTLMLTLTTNDFQQRGWYDGDKPMSKYEAFAMATMIEHLVIFCRIFIEYYFNNISTRVIKCQALDELEEQVFYNAVKSEAESAA